MELKTGLPEMTDNDIEKMVNERCTIVDQNHPVFSGSNEDFVSVIHNGIASLKADGSFAASKIKGQALAQK
jgi:hypothetical protein